MKEIVRDLGGWIDVETLPGAGSVFKIYLPAVDAERGRRSESARETLSYARRSERVLLVEDDLNLREFARTALSAYGYEVITAADSDEAVAIFESSNETIDLFFSDVILPGRSGLELAEMFLLKKPDLKVLLSSGYNDERSHEERIRNKGFSFIRKPYSLPELLKAAGE